jgi:hypothetical protein
MCFQKHRYTINRHDGHGGSANLMLGGMIVADKLGLNYGGSLGSAHYLSYNHNNEVSGA